MIIPNRTNTNPMPGVAKESNAAHTTNMKKPAERLRNFFLTTPVVLLAFKKKPMPLKINKEIKKTKIKMKVIYPVLCPESINSVPGVSGSTNVKDSIVLKKRKYSKTTLNPIKIISISFFLVGANTSAPMLMAKVMPGATHI